MLFISEVTTVLRKHLYGKSVCEESEVYLDFRPLYLDKQSACGSVFWSIQLRR